MSRVCQVMLSFIYEAPTRSQVFIFRLGRQGSKKLFLLGCVKHFCLSWIYSLLLNKKTMALQFKDKVVIVTGSSAGIGEAIALIFASRGAKVTFTGRDKERLEAVVDKAVQLSGRSQDSFLSVLGDLTESTIRQEIVQQTIQKFGRLDVLVLNAGILGDVTSIENYSEEAYDRVLNTNLKSVFFLIQQALPFLETTRGNIVCISSIVSVIPYTQGIPYACAKAALDHLIRCLAVDLGAKGIRVNSVSPGYFRTLSLRDLDPKVPELLEPVERNLRPLKGKDGAVQDVAEAVAYLASEAASFVTGVQLSVDGGRTLVGNFNF